jgi:hypothetical protein
MSASIFQPQVRNYRKSLNSSVKSFVLGEIWVNRRMKPVRSWLIHLPGRVAGSFSFGSSGGIRRT